MSQWPRDDQGELIAFYGDPATDEVEPQLVSVAAPWQMFYENKPISHFMFHQKAVGALTAALAEIWQVCKEEQTLVEHYGLHRFSGTYNKRLVRGSQTKWSNHAFGAAIDLDAEHNGMGASKGVMPDFAVRAFKRQGARWGGDYHGRKDPMHFEFCDNGEHEVIARGTLPIEAPHADAHEGMEPEPAPKPMSHSKISNAQIVVGAGGTIAAADQIDTALQQVERANDIATHFHDVAAHTFGFWAVLAKSATQPGFWFSLFVIAVAGATIYWRWRDHGPGKVQ